MTDGATFTLKNSALVYPAAGFNIEEDHFAVLLDGLEVSTIFALGDEWFWSINLSMMGLGNGRTQTIAEARAAFRKTWDERVARLGPVHVARAMAVARGRG